MAVISKHILLIPKLILLLAFGLNTGWVTANTDVVKAGVHKPSLKPGYRKPGAGVQVQGSSHLVIPVSAATSETIVLAAPTSTQRATVTLTSSPGLVFSPQVVWEFDAQQHFEIPLVFSAESAGQYYLHLSVTVENDAQQQQSSAVSISVIAADKTQLSKAEKMTLTKSTLNKTGAIEISGSGEKVKVFQADETTGP